MGPFTKDSPASPVAVGVGGGSSQEGVTHRGAFVAGQSSPSMASGAIWTGVPRSRVWELSLEGGRGAL